MFQDIYSATLRLNGENTNDFHCSQQLRGTLANAGRYKEAKALLRKTIPVARRVLGDSKRTHAQDEGHLRHCAPLEHRRHARRSPRGRDDARGGSNGSRGACSVVSTRSPWRLADPCKTRSRVSARSAPAKGRRRAPTPSTQGNEGARVRTCLESRRPARIRPRPPPDPPSSATSTTLSPRTSTWARCRVRGRARAGLRIFGVVVSAASTNNKFMCRSNALRCPTTTPSYGVDAPQRHAHSNSIPQRSP